ncbi:MAG: hypothetical protein KW788_01285 [Candidatus Doudnabacteria bacterium]|nr:hypothetical protein [Candidatus Doudnabacteria bacterium]
MEKIYDLVLFCPNCRKCFNPGEVGMSLAEDVCMTGNCPSCDTSVFSQTTIKKLKEDIQVYVNEQTKKQLRLVAVNGRAV